MLENLQACFFYFFENFTTLATQYQPSEAHACPWVPIDRLVIGPGPPFSGFDDLKVPAIRKAHTLTRGKKSAQALLKS